MSKHSQSRDLTRIADALESNATSVGRDTSREDYRRKAKGKEKLPLRARFVLWYGGGSAVHARNVRMRETFEILAMVGPNGGGKSLCAVSQALHSLDEGRRVLSTVPLFDTNTGELHPLYEPFYDWEQFLEARDTLVFADEIVGIANSRDATAGKLNTPIQNRLMQCRKYDNLFLWTAPAWDRADKIIRQVTKGVVECRGYFAGRPVADPVTGRLKMWAPKRAFRFATYDMVEFDQWTAGKRENLKPIVKEWFRGPGSREFRAYDTLGSVSMVAHASESGVCDTCGGMITRKRCSCGNPYRDRRPTVLVSEGGGAGAVLDEHAHEFELIDTH
ncbi:MULTISPECIES: hypothetical protein [unclassified Leifsonia]|uniref:hypothetical protein n=1 Tax=unclassified Leifsonia TaxID=2663824 RepID=UPI0008A7ACA2|nr:MULTISPECIES: hypothetical protein [unclassified Leifsonia]SEH84173.1 hypothetical protein SAMN04515694_10542 [Leifsonia sp. CL154]SFL46838.1 hypothetical protein SAMN04515692_10541 [Leifsonia sp. CL147]